MLAASATAHGAPTARRNVISAWAWPIEMVHMIGRASQAPTSSTGSRSPRRLKVRIVAPMTTDSQMIAAT